MQNVPSEHGFSLIEVLMVLVLLAVMMAIAAPGLSALIVGSRLSAASGSLFSSVVLARSEAIKRTSRGVLCKTADGVSCSASGGWEQGWIVFHDNNNNVVVDAGENVVLYQQSLGDGIRLWGNFPVANYLSFTPQGRARYVSGAFQAGTFTACSVVSGNTDARQIIISSSGRPRAIKTSVDQCP